MADTVVSFAIENVGNFLIQEATFLSGVRGEVEEMQIELEWMQCFLKDAERRKGESHRVRNWVSQIREATYDVEDLIEHFVLKSALRNRKGVVNCIKKYACFINHAAELHQLGSGIEAIKAKLTNLRTRLQIYGIKELRVGGEEAAAARSSRKSQEYAHVVDHNVVGLEEKITELAEQLIDGKEAIRVCIYGMGGLGKTTAAKQVYNDNRIKAHFECFAWVYISRQFNQRKVWETILTQLSGKKIEAGMSDDELTSQLCRLQKDKKCLLVLDDIWEARDWDELSAAFPYPDGDYRSKILFTTCNKNVASHKVYHTSLNLLDPNNSFKLLKNTILFLGGPDHPIESNSTMKTYAEEMVKESTGLPLAIIVLGGVLATKHEVREWERVRDNIKSYLNTGEQEGNDGVASVLESSYDDLPYHLKTCFLYLSQYQEDKEIKTRELMQRWIAEGFVSSSTGRAGVTMEEIAAGYLNELVNRCMIQAGTRGHTGRVKTCRVHDLVRDLCISKAEEEGFSQSVELGVDDEGTELLDNVSSRRVCVSLGTGGESVLSPLLETSPQLRSIRFHGGVFDKRKQGRAVSSVIKKLKFVRVLELVSTGLVFQGTYTTMRIVNHIHMRFLKLSAPDLCLSVGNLRCLETLILDSCETMKIPDSIWGMEQLRHLYLPEYCKCESSKQRVGNVQNLQTLVNFPPLKFDLEQNLVKFKGVRKLVICRRDADEICKITKRQEIVFDRLQSLSFVYTGDSVDLEAMTRGSPRLYRLVFKTPSATPTMWPSSLTKLVLGFSNLNESHMRAVGKLQSLEVLFLHFGSISGKEMTFHEGDFPKLRHLLVESLREFEAWEFRGGALPSLSCLEIHGCRELRSFPAGTQFLKQLKEIKLTYMRYDLVKRMERGGDDWDKRVIYSFVSFPPSSIIIATQFEDDEDGKGDMAS